MTWVATKIFLKRSWLWLKHHWQVPFLAFWTLVVFVFARRNTEAYVDVLSAKKESYEKQIKELKNQHKNEIIERDRLIQEYYNTIEVIEKKYKEKEKVLTEKEKKKIKEIVTKSKGEPHVIRKQIEESFDFLYID